jgi:heptaprenyl diphosphate synthase
LFPTGPSVAAMRLVDDLGLPALPEDLRRVEEALQAAVKVDDRFLGDVASHLLGAGGKRLRPTLTLCAAYAVTGDSRNGGAGAGRDVSRPVTGGASVELVHLGSLYHDDVIDEAETRRGVPSVNARWSNIVAILSGDFLLAQASALAASLGADVAGLLAATIGELCRGQVLELQYLFNSERTEESYFSAIEGKTASLLATAARIGGMVSDATAPALDALTRFGHHLGMCFQIVDDVLDVTRTEAELGKPVGNDLLEGVYTLPVIYAVTESSELGDLLGRALDPDRLDQARALVATDDVVEASMAVARTHATKATEALAGTDDLDPFICERLAELVNALVGRTQ